MSENPIQNLFVGTQSSKHNYQRLEIWKHIIWCNMETEYMVDIQAISELPWTSDKVAI